MKIRLNICLTQEESEILDKKAKGLSLSKSALLGRLITQELHITQQGHIQNDYTPVNHPEGLLEELKKMQVGFFTKLDKLLLEDRQEIYDLIKKINN